MKKILLIIILLPLLYAKAQEVHFLVPESFNDFGSWRIEANDNAWKYTLVGSNPQYPRTANPATATIDITQEGDYRIWVHARDFTYQPGSRYFNLEVNDQMAKTTFGRHGKNRFLWTDGGVHRLKKGENIIKLIDTSKFYARCDGVLITGDINSIPPEDYQALTKQVSPSGLSRAMESPIFPNWAKENLKSKKSSVLENNNTRIIFHLVKHKTHGDFIQNEIYVKDNGAWVRVKNKTDEHGYLMLKAAISNKGHWIEDYTFFDQRIDKDGKLTAIKTSNVYKSGEAIWLLPTGMKKIREDKVILTFNNTQSKDEDITVTWELVKGMEDPKVTLEAVFHDKGAWSFALFSGREYSDKEYESAVAPFRVMNKRIPQEPNLLIEHYLFTPMGSVSLPPGNELTKGKPLTTAVVVAPDCLPGGYVYRETSKVGVCMRGPEGGVRGHIFAPLFGSDYCTFNAGDKYSISYRIVNRLGNWFDTYKHIAKNIYNVHDYRSNYYTSLNEAIYNTTDLMLDDMYGGWDPIDKAHYNMEEKDLTSVANPMAVIQRYLLTENDRLLKHRVIPTIANLLTRERLHFKRFDSKGGANYLGSVKKPVQIGKPIQGYNLNVFGGIFEMSRGLTPALLAIGMEKAGLVTNQYGNIPSFSNDLALFHYTKNPKYLERAKEKADKYLVEVVYNDAYNSKIPSFSSFINISYYPNLASLLDIYQATKEQRYLDAAIKTGQMLSATLWVPGIDGGKDTTSYTIERQETLKRPFMQGHNFWWHGSQQWRLGNKYGEVKPSWQSGTPLEEETVPGWLPARVGLGLEQCSTFGEALNIYMNTWAGDMMKLSALSGEKYFETVAKNAIIGRFGNYAGYYQNRYITHQMKPDYPYRGPDLTSIYFHHIPPFLAMLEDFLINQVWALSGMQIEFPAIRQQGYAYFNSNHYGFESGRFYDITGMWLWNDKGIIYPDSKAINYLPMRKNGLFAVALTNEAHTATTTTIQLGEKLQDAKIYSGKADLYREDGSKEPINITEGKFTVTIPAKSMRSVAIQLPGIKQPVYAQVKYNTNSVNTKKTVTTHHRGKGYIIQFTPDKYAAYLYITDLPEETNEMRINYRAGKQVGAITVKEYPFEAIIEVDHAPGNFTYDIEVTKQDGTIEKISGDTLEPITHK